MTLQQIIKLLETSGKNTKQQVHDIQKVCDMLKNANDVELKELRDSIDLKLEFENEKHRKM